MRDAGQQRQKKKQNKSSNNVIYAPKILIPARKIVIPVLNVVQKQNRSLLCLLLGFYVVLNGQMDI